MGNNLGQQNMWKIIHERAKSFKNHLIPPNSQLPRTHSSNSSNELRHPQFQFQPWPSCASWSCSQVSANCAWFISIAKFFFNYLNASPIHPVTSLFQSQEVAKTVLGQVVAIAGLLPDQSKDPKLLQSGFITVALHLGLVATFNGMLMKGMYPRAGSVMEKLGVALIYLSFFRISSLSFPPALEWLFWVGFTFIFVPLVLSLLPINSTEEITPVDPPNNMV